MTGESDLPVAVEHRVLASDGNCTGTSEVIKVGPVRCSRVNDERQVERVVVKFH